MIFAQHVQEIQCFVTEAQPGRETALTLAGKYLHFLNAVEKSAAPILRLVELQIYHHPKHCESNDVYLAWHAWLSLFCRGRHQASNLGDHVRAA